MKNNEMTHHFMETRNLISQAEEQINSVSAPILNTSQIFAKTNETYSGYKSTIQKSDLYLTQLTKQHKRNIMFVYGSFFFLIIVVGFIILRRLFYPKFYSDMGKYILLQTSQQDL